MDDFTSSFSTLCQAFQNEFKSKVTIVPSLFDEYDFQANVTGIIKQKNTSEAILNTTAKYINSTMFHYKIINPPTNQNVTFLVFYFTDEYIEKFLSVQNQKTKMVNYDKQNKLVLVDYASPNIAKDMHVGHLRSTVIGDSLSNLFEYTGYTVLRISHIGDFGTQFGSIINYILENNITNIKAEELQDIYVKAKKCFETNEKFKQKAYDIIKSIQNDQHSPYDEIWKEIVTVSYTSYQKIFDIMHVYQTVQGESYYKPLIPNMLDKFKSQFTDENGMIIISGDVTIPPLIVVKSNGGYTYDTTDLTAIDYRCNDVKADIILYVVDSGQETHFKQLFSVATKLGIITSQIVEHVSFGVVLGEDRKRIRSRNGDTPKLWDLIDDAYNAGKKSFTERNLTNDDIMNIAVSCVKYSDLSTNRSTDYVFSPESMISFKGNTYVYLAYAYVRCLHIMDKLNETIGFTQNNDIINDDTVMIRKVLQLPYYLNKSMNDRSMHTLCTYIYKLVESYQSYYDSNRCIDFVQKTVYMKRIEITRCIMKVMSDIFGIIGLSIINKI